MYTTDTFFTHLLQHPPEGSVVASSLTLSPTMAARCSYPSYFPNWLIALAQQQGILQLTEAQCQAFDLLQSGQHVCLATPKHGGRNLVRVLSMYQALSHLPHGHGLFLLPSQQHELTQWQSLATWNALLPPEYRLTTALYDKDTPRSVRQAIKQLPPRLLLTLPEILHLGILPYHDTWRSFFQNLRYIVVVDMHRYHGASGTHLAHLLRRLQRIAAYYNSHPQYLLTGLPLAHLPELAQSLTGQPCHIVVGPAYQTQPHSQLLLAAASDPEAVCRNLIRSYYDAGLTVLVFSPSALQGEHEISFSPHASGLEETYTATELRFLASDKTALVLPYDTALLRLSSHAFTHTIFLTLPSSFTDLQHYLAWQAGALTPRLSTIIVSGRTPMERYLLRYPEISYQLWLQELFLHTTHSSITRAHLHCAVAELAWRTGERYSDHDNLEHLLQQLTSEKVLERHVDSQVWTARQRWPHRHVSLSSYTDLLTIIDLLHHRPLTKVPLDKAFRECFEGALYRKNDGKAFLVKRFLQERQHIFVSPSQEGLRRYTQGIFTIKAEDFTTEAAIQQSAFQLVLGKCLLTETLYAYEVRDAKTGQRCSLHVVPQRQRQYHTSALRCDYFTPWSLTAESIHTFLHAVLATTPLWSLGNEDDFFGIFAHSSEPDHSYVLFADACDGGNGASIALYRSFERVLRLALQLLLQCDCQSGCPKCLSARSCNACRQGIPKQRQAGIALLQRWTDEIIPSFASVQASLSAPSLQPSTEFFPLYLTLSTQKSAEEVGGWQHTHLLRLGIAVTYDTRDGQWRVYTEETVVALLESLQTARMVIGFNLYAFDYQVLQPYSRSALAQLPSLAILEKIRQQLGFRLSLQHLARETLGIERPSPFQQMVQWYRDGEFSLIVQQCQKDLALLRGLVQYGREHGILRYRDQTGTPCPLPVNWVFSLSSM